MSSGQQIDLQRASSIVLVTGAGVSVASGLRPYRGPGGLWDEGEEDAELATKEAMLERPEECWRMFSRLRVLATRAQPNAAHLAIASMERRFLGDKDVTVITQNVDGLHQRAGSREVIELHGSITRSRCSSEACTLQPFEDHASPVEAPRCPLCRSPLRPDVVLFNEYIPVDAEHRSKLALRECDLFIAVGTSGTVEPAASFVRSAKYAGARTHLVNLEPMLVQNDAFENQHLGRAEELLPRLFA